MPAESLSRLDRPLGSAGNATRFTARRGDEFTPRELDVLRLLADGLDTAAMSSRLGIAPHTVEWHVRHVIEKLQVHSKLQAVISAARKGLIEL